MEEVKSNKIRMRERIISAGFYFGKMISLIYGTKLSLLFTDMFTSFYSGWLSRNFKNCGENLSIGYPMHHSGLKYISVGNNLKIGPRLRLEAHDRFLDTVYTPQILIGNNVNINFDCHIGCVDKIEIADGVLIGSKVLIIDHQHGNTSLAGTQLSPAERPLVTKGPVKIGNNVWIGESCVIMPGVQIGANSIIGSNAVVTKSFGANLVIAGNPAKIIGTLS